MHPARLAAAEQTPGINFRLVWGLYWHQVLDAVRSLEVDVISLLNETPGRTKYLNFAGPIISTPYVIVTSKYFKPVTNLSDMTTNCVAVMKDSAIVELGQMASPNLIIRTAEPPPSGLRAVSSGKI